MAQFGTGTANYPRYFYTGQEYDEETGLHNFRARLYDPDLFRFYAIDPAGQQVSGYAFVGNSPMLYVDPSGQWFFSAFLPGIGTAIDAALWGATIGAGTSTASYLVTSAIYRQPITLGGFGKAAGLGALGGALSGGLSLLGSQLGAFGTSFTYSALSNVGSYAATNAVVGGKFDLPGVLGSLAGATIGATFPNFQAVSTNPIVNIVAELAYGGLEGALIGGISSGVTAGFRGQDPLNGFLEGAKYGGFSGALSTGINMAIWGYAVPYNEASLERIQNAEDYYGVELGQNLPTLRTGGLSRLFSNRGFSWFDSSVLNGEFSTEIAAHEGAHAVQRQKMGWYNFYEKLNAERLLGPKVYKFDDYFEGQAQRLGRGHIPKRK